MGSYTPPETVSYEAMLAGNMNAARIRSRFAIRWDEGGLQCRACHALILMPHGEATVLDLDNAAFEHEHTAHATEPSAAERGQA